MIPTGQDSLKTRSTLEAGGKSYAYYSLDKAGAALGDVSRLPFSMKVLLENLLRFEDGKTVTPSSNRRRFSSSTFIEKGRRETSPSTAPALSSE